MSNHMTHEQAVEIYGERNVNLRKELNKANDGNTFNYEDVASYVRDWGKNTREILEKVKKGYKLYE